MDFTRVRRFLLDGGMVYLYALFIAGYFLLPMAAGHRRLYYILVLPAVVILAGERWRFYRGNILALLILLYSAWMMSTLAWTEDFIAAEAFWTIWYALALLSFIFISGYLWVTHPERMDLLARRCLWLAGAAALVSIVAWYLRNPFPSSRLEPLGVMHHQNKSACAYGVFLTLCTYYLFTSREPRQRYLYAALSAIMLALVVFTQSRTALGAVCVALVVLLGYRALALVGVGLAVSWILLAGKPEEWWYRVETFSFRPGIWEQVLAGMPGHWITGRGYLLDPHIDAYRWTFDHAHNGYLATLRDGGLIGLTLLLAILAIACQWAWQLFRQRGERIYLALLLYGMTCIFMDFDRLFVHPKELWLFFWLPIALVMVAHGSIAADHPARYGRQLR